MMVTDPVPCCGSDHLLVWRRQEMFEQPEMPDALFMEEMDALIPDMYDPPGGASPPSDPKEGSVPTSGAGGAQGAPGSTQSGGHPNGGAAAAAAATQHDPAKLVWVAQASFNPRHSPCIAKARGKRPTYVQMCGRWFRLLPGHWLRMWERLLDCLILT